MNLTLQRVSKRTFRALALVRESLSRKANTRYIIFETLNSGRFTCILSTHLIKPNHFVGLSDRRSRTVSLETYPPHKKKDRTNFTFHQSRLLDEVSSLTKTYRTWTVVQAPSRYKDNFSSITNLVMLSSSSRSPSAFSSNIEPLMT